MHWVLVAAALLILSCPTWAQETGAGGETIPKTFDGAGHTVREGGQQIGEGFKGVGRGLKDVFTGEESKEDFKDAAKMGLGFRDVGRGVAGTGRAVGEGFKKGFGHPATVPPPEPEQ